MSDGLAMRIVGDPIGTHFTLDTFGTLLPDPSKLQMQWVGQQVERQLAAKTGLGRRLAEVYYRADVESTNRPLGSTPVIMAGLKLFGPNPIKRERFRGKLKIAKGDIDPRLRRSLEKRQRKIENYIREDVISVLEAQPADTESLKLIKKVEMDQTLTGGGYDNTKVGDCTLSALNFISKASEKFDIADSTVSKLIIEAALKLKRYFNEKVGIHDGSVRLTGAHAVRALQETDGMIGFPIFAKSSAPLTRDIAVRILIDVGVDVRQMVDSEVKDPISGVTRPATVVDAIAAAMDKLTIEQERLTSIVTTLVRIQRHGYKRDDGELIAKDGKTRSIYPNSAFAAFQEAMVFTSLLNIWKEKKLAWMPSLQNKPTRVAEIMRWLTEEVLPNEYDAWSADWSKYDATVKGSLFATVMYYAIRPLYHADDQKWVDLAIKNLTFKYVMVSTDLASLHQEFNEVKEVAPYVEVPGYTLFGATNGLISGAKFTHGGGSLYGEAVIHYVIPSLLGYTPIWGPQAGDDTLVAIPKSMIDLNNPERAMGPFVEAALQCGLDINLGKQMWHYSKGELLKVFLQDYYHVAEEIHGVGSIFRYHAAAMFAEYDRGLSPAEQYLAGISKYNNGADNPFCKAAIRSWFENDDFIGAIFKEYGKSGFDAIIKAAGDKAKGLDFTYTWGTDKEEFLRGDIPILPLMVEVAGEMSFPLTGTEALSRLGALPSGTDENIIQIPESPDDDED